MSTKQIEALKLAQDWYDSGHEDPDEFTAMIKAVMTLAEQPAPVASPHKQQEPIGWEYVVQLLIAVGHVSKEKVDHACAIAKAQQQEPVAWVGSLKDPQPHCVTDLKYCSAAQWDTGYHLKYIPLYTSPPASKPWVGLTQQEQASVLASVPTVPFEGDWHLALFTAIEAKLREKNA